MSGLAAVDFTPSFKARMIAAYPVISQMSADESYFADAGAMDKAFERVLSSRHIGPVCVMAHEDNPKVRAAARPADPDRDGEGRA